MKRSAVQDFANVCCQMFLSSLTNSDRLNLVIFGTGIVTMDFLSQHCSHNNVPVSPLFYAVAFREWLEAQCRQHGSDIRTIEMAEMTVEVVLETYRKEEPAMRGWLCSRMAFKCSSHLVYENTSYTSEAVGSEDIGLGQLLHGHHY